MKFYLVTRSAVGTTLYLSITGALSDLQRRKIFQTLDNQVLMSAIPILDFGVPLPDWVWGVEELDDAVASEVCMVVD